MIWGRTSCFWIKSCKNLVTVPKRSKKSFVGWNNSSYVGYHFMNVKNLNPFSFFVWLRVISTTLWYGLYNAILVFKERDCMDHMNHRMNIKMRRKINPNRNISNILNNIKRTKPLRRKLFVKIVNLIRHQWTKYDLAKNCLLPDTLKVCLSPKTLLPVSIWKWFMNTVHVQENL